MKKLLLIALAFLLIAAAALQVRMEMNRPAVTGLGMLPSEKIPRSLPGWNTQDIPLGATEANSKDAAKMLNFDSYVCRQFRRGDVEITVYIAYWSAGKMPIQEVSCHSPDVCWVANGWITEQAASNTTLQAGGIGINGAEYRLFRSGDGNRQHVYFWHVVGERIFMTYGDRYRSVAAISAWWKDITLQPLRSPQEQRFIRVSSTHKLESLGSEGGIEEILKGIELLVPGHR